MSGLRLNLHKSVIYGVGQDDSMAYQLVVDLGCQVGNLPMTYLALPLSGRILSYANWNHVVDSFGSKLALWKSRHLSMGGRFTLIISMLSFIFIYSLSVKLLLAKVRNSLNDFILKFLLGGRDERGKMHLVDWKSIMAPCVHGGFGVSDLADMNVALIVKLILCYANERDKLWKRVFCAKSGSDPNTLLISMKQRSRRSSLVSLIGLLLDKNEEVSSLVRSCFRPLIGNGMH